MISLLCFLFGYHSLPFHGEDSKKIMHLNIHSHLEKLPEQPQKISRTHVKAQAKLIEEIVNCYKKEGKVDLIIVCTGNSRRSMMGAAMGNAAVTFHGLKGIHFYSGGTQPSAFNIRSIKALTDIGFEIVETGEKAPKGLKGEENPCYKIRWGNDKSSSMVEFSKKYNDPFNPQKGFIAIMVCNEADMECPSVAGASARISLPFADPKDFDGTPLESAKYAERRDDLGRFMLSTFQMVREELKKQGL
ncbi:MAG: hypothetical protein RL595_3476 [Planctomycetota bacterium]